MACCLVAPNHYLHQCWLITSKFQWHSSKANFTKENSAINHLNHLVSFLKSTRDQWVNSRWPKTMLYGQSTKKGLSQDFITALHWCHMNAKHLKSPADQLFAHQLVRLTSKEHLSSKLLTGCDQWIFPINGQLCRRKCVHVIIVTGLIPGLHPANERQCYFVSTSLIGWAQT